MNEKGQKRFHERKERRTNEMHERPNKLKPNTYLPENFASLDFRILIEGAFLCCAKNE